MQLQYGLHNLRIFQTYTCIKLPHVVFHNEQHNSRISKRIQYSKSIRIIVTHKYELLYHHKSSIQTNTIICSYQNNTLLTMVWRILQFRDLEMRFLVDLICLSCFMLQNLPPNLLSNWWLLLVVPPQHGGSSLESAGPVLSYF